jgi:hypothetical protein
MPAVASLLGSASPNAPRRHRKYFERLLRSEKPGSSPFLKCKHVRQDGRTALRELWTRPGLDSPGIRPEALMTMDSDARRQLTRPAITLILEKK